MIETEAHIKTMASTQILVIHEFLTRNSTVRGIISDKMTMRI